MSRVGNAIIDIPNGVDISVEKNIIHVKGPKGSLNSPLFEGIAFKIEDQKISVRRENDSKSLRAKHGLVRALLANCIKGTVEGFSKTLMLEGVGYRANKKGKQLVLTLGYSHEIIYNEPEDISLETIEQTKIRVSGIDKQRVGEVSAQLRALRPPEPYKGKGVRYEDEIIRRKAGKAGRK